MSTTVVLVFAVLALFRFGDRNKYISKDKLSSKHRSWQHATFPSVVPTQRTVRQIAPHCLVGEGLKCRFRKSREPAT